MEKFVALKASVIIDAPVKLVWKLWTEKQAVKLWNKPSLEWETAKVEIDFKEKGIFLYHMRLVDKSFGFDHTGTFETIIPLQKIIYSQTDGRKSVVTFSEKEGKTTITEKFDADADTPLDEQKWFCNGVLNTFKAYCEGFNKK